VPPLGKRPLLPRLLAVQSGFDAVGYYARDQGCSSSSGGEIVNSRTYISRDGVRHLANGTMARCGAGSLALVLRPEEHIEFRCNLCWPPRSLLAALAVLEEPQ